ncbi:MAG TPA: NAD-dependent malic enzyme, partial [Candidatus Micrarchaeota archaeon]|nr:NAD-dependent malic enzyme [Candidatus Micrarchaeota archaeon]
IWDSMAIQEYLAELQKELCAEKIVPAPFERHVHFNVALAVAQAAQQEGVAKNPMALSELEENIKKSL